MNRTVIGLATGLAASFAIGLAAAQQHDPKMHGSSHGAGHGRAPTADARIEVAIPEPMKGHMLANMRDHLLALQEIQLALSSGRNADAAKVAETRLGMSSLSVHGAHEVAKFMPQGMQEAGTGMHRAASRFAIAAQDAGVTGDLKLPLATLAEVTGQCVACHAGYKLK